MLTIRQVQLQELAQGAFERTALTHVQRHFPRHVAALGGVGTLQAIRAARARAASLGFSGERESAHYIDLTFMFGEDFYAGASGAWAASILADRRLTDAPQRMARLYQAAIERLQQLAAVPEVAAGV